MSNFSGLSGVGLGSIGSSLGSYNGSRSSGSSGSSSSSGRSNQLVSMSLSEFVDVDVDDYEDNGIANPDDFEIDRTQGHEPSAWDRFTAWASRTGGNIVVGFTSIVSGVGDVVEHVGEGGDG